MCYFITVAVSEEAAQEFLAAVPRGFEAFPCQVRSVTEHIPGDFTQLLLVSGGCSCGLYSPEVLRNRETRNEQLRRKYRKRKWSHAKIERAIESSVAAHRPTADSESRGYDSRVRELIAASAEAHGDIRIIVHYYSGDVETEAFDVQRGPTATPSAFRKAGFRIEEDELVTVIGNRQQFARRRG